MRPLYAPSATRGSGGVVKESRAQARNDGLLDARTIVFADELAAILVHHD